jgi:hypothetical protein
MIIKNNLKRIYRTDSLEKKQQIEMMLANNQIQYVTIIDDMFWSNFMGEQRFNASKKAPQSYSIYIYKTYRNEAFHKAKNLIATI